MPMHVMLYDTKRFSKEELRWMRWEIGEASVHSMLYGGKLADRWDGIEGCRDGDNR